MFIQVYLTLGLNLVIKGVMRYFKSYENCTQEINNSL